MMKNVIIAAAMLFSIFMYSQEVFPVSSIVTGDLVNPARMEVTLTEELIRFDYKNDSYPDFEYQIKKVSETAANKGRTRVYNVTEGTVPDQRIRVTVIEYKGRTTIQVDTFDTFTNISTRNTYVK